MIIKIDHLAFCTVHMRDALKAFATLGYEVHFKEDGLRDLDNKKIFMKRFSGKLDMALMNHSGSISIELLNHGHAIVEDSYILPVLEGVPVETDQVGDSIVSCNYSFARVKCSSLKAEFFIMEGTRPTEFRCNKVIVNSYNIEKSTDFWCRLGFRIVSVDDIFTQLEFKVPLSDESYRLYIRKKEPQTNVFRLDTQGFNCIAFVSTDTEKDGRRFEGLGMRPTETNLFRVNGKDLRIFWLPGPCGEIVEIIGLA